MSEWDFEVGEGLCNMSAFSLTIVVLLCMEACAVKMFIFSGTAGLTESKTNFLMGTIKVIFSYLEVLIVVVYILT